MPSLLSGKLEKTFSIVEGPYLHASHSTQNIFWGISAALIPVWFSALFIFGWDAFRLLLLAVGSGIASEFLFGILNQKPLKRFDASAVLVSVLFALLLPPNLSSFRALLGIFAALGIGKYVFGGLGQNLFHPVLVGHSVLMALFPESFSQGFSKPTSGIWYHFFVAPSHVLGGASLFAVLLAGGLLLWKGWIQRALPFVYWVSILICSLLVSHGSISNFFEPMFFLYGFFLVTDFVTTPVTKSGRLLFAFSAGFLAAFFHFWMAAPQALTSSILLMNGMTPLLDRLGWRKRR